MIVPIDPVKINPDVYRRAIHDSRLSLEARGMLVALLDTDTDLGAAGQPIGDLLAVSPAGTEPADLIPALTELGRTGWLAEVARINDARHGRIR